MPIRAVPEAPSFWQVSIDFDYFSQHSHSGGGLFPMWMMPMPTPSYPPEEAGADGADADGALLRRPWPVSLNVTVGCRRWQAVHSF